MKSRTETSPGWVRRILGRTPAWLLICEAVLAIAALLVVAYKFVTMVRPLGEVQVVRAPVQRDPHTQIFEYYREFPERYVTAENQSWKYDLHSGTATHSFVLKNKGTAGYKDIHVKLNYLSAAGEILRTREAPVDGTLSGLSTLRVAGLPVPGVPAASESVTIQVSKATILE